MRAVLPAVLVLLAACDEPPGLTLEVVPLDPSIEYVEVYLADHCQGCPDAMTPPMMRAHSADMYETDYPMVFSASKSEPQKWKNGHAFFRVTSPDGADSYVTYLLLVGFDANKTPIAINRFGGVMVPGGGSEYWQVLLDEPVQPLTDMASDTERIAIWGMNRTGPRCVLVVNSDGRATGVVPKDDPDCDGQLQHDCAPYIPNAVRAAPDIDHASCVVPVPAVAGFNTSAVCLIGGPPCTDGTLSTGCEPVNIDYCAPSKACSACPYPGDWASCVALKLANPDTTGVVPWAGCSIAMNTDGTECSDATKRTAEMDLGGLLSGGGGTKCTGIKMHALTLPLGPFVDNLDLAGGTLELANFQEPCKVEVRWSGNFIRGSGPQNLVLDVALDNGKHLALPFLFHGNDGCAVDSTCKLNVPDPSDSMLLCTKPAMDTTTCTSSTTQCQNGGVACGARCCGPGETCSDGACHCGDGPACADSTCVLASPNPTPQPGACGEVCCGSGPGAPACM